MRNGATKTNKESITTNKRTKKEKYTLTLWNEKNLLKIMKDKSDNTNERNTSNNIGERI